MAGYALPSWLETHPDDIANKFVSGVQIGAQLGEARNKLAQQAQQSAVENQITQDKLAASTLEQAQQLKVQQAYNDQQISLKQQQVEAAQQKVQNETLKAARQYQFQQAYQKDYQDALDSGLPQDQAAKGALFKNLPMFGSGSGVSGAINGLRENSIQAPTFFKDPNSNATIAMGPKGHILRTDTGMGKAGQPDFWTKLDVSQLTKEKAALQKAQSEDTFGATTKNAMLKKTYSDRAARIQAIDQQLQGMRGTNAPAASGAKFRWNPDTQSIEDNTAPSDQEE